MFHDACVYILTDLILATALEGRHYYNQPHVVHEETEKVRDTWRGWDLNARASSVFWCVFFGHALQLAGS